LEAGPTARDDRNEGRQDQIDDDHFGKAGHEETEHFVSPSLRVDVHGVIRSNGEFLGQLFGGCPSRRAVLFVACP
jgi:hypothetical protein